MGLFDAINTADTGVNMSQDWLDAISNNLANANDVTQTSKPAYQEEFIDAQAIPGTGVIPPGGNATEASLGGGVAVTGTYLTSPVGQVVSDPTSPIADSKGDVRMPDVDMAQQMTDMIMAQRSYEANLNTIATATQAYQAALGLKL